MILEPRRMLTRVISVRKDQVDVGNFVYDLVFMPGVMNRIGVINLSKEVRIVDRKLVIVQVEVQTLGRQKLREHPRTSV